MKLILFWAIFISSNVLFGQTNSIRDIFVYNQSKDTIYLNPNPLGIDFGGCGSLIIVDSIQVDGAGSKEIIFHRNCTGDIHIHNAKSDISESIKISKYEIWNLDTKEMIFEATHTYNCTFSRSRLPDHRSGVESYTYDFKIDSTGQITISNFNSIAKAYKTEWKRMKRKKKYKDVRESVPYEYTLSPDKKEGTYRFVNSKYILE